MTDPLLTSVDALLLQELERAQVPLIVSVAEHLLKSGGKRIRPRLLLLLAQALHCPNDTAVILSAVVELVHAATLLHDDVVDEADLRRNQPSANALWGNQASVLVGDFLYSSAFRLLVQLESTPILGAMAEATHLIAQGEVQQLVYQHNPDISETQYFGMITEKTARLFSVASLLPALAVKLPNDQAQLLKNFGLYYGICYQLIDDALDYTSSSDELGKPAQADLSHGKPTLPFIYALEQGTPAERDTLRESWKTGDMETINRLVASLKAIDYTFERAKAYANRAVDCLLSALPPSFYRDMLVGLCEQALTRRS